MELLYSWFGENTDKLCKFVCWNNDYDRNGGGGGGVKSFQPKINEVILITNFYYPTFYLFKMGVNKNSNDVVPLKHHHFIFCGNRIKLN